MQRLEQLFTNSWAIDRPGMDGLMTMLSPCIMAGKLDVVEEYLKKKNTRVLALEAPYMAREWELDDIQLPDNSIAVLQLTGILYAWETSWLIKQVKRVEQNPKICGMVLLVDGPGGHATQVDILSDTIRNLSKPTATVVVGAMCSAHFWIGTSTDRTFLASKLCLVGSVGVMQEYTDFKGYLRAQGVDIRDIYPDTSDLKNEDSRAIENDNDESITKRRLERMHMHFANAISRNLDIAYDPKHELFRGRVFSTDEAIAAKYADQEGSLEDAVIWVLGRAMSKKAKEILN